MGIKYWHKQKKYRKQNLTANIPEKEGELEEETPEGNIFPDGSPLHHAFPQIFPN